MNSLLSICLNEIKSFTKMVLLLNLTADVPLTNYVIKADDVKLIPSGVIFKGDTVHEAVLMQNRKFRLFCLNLVSTCSSRSKKNTNDHKQRNYLKFKVAKSCVMLAIAAERLLT